MNRFAFALLVSLPLVAAPVAAFAQDGAQSADIVVTAKFQRDWDKGNEMEAKGLRDLEQAKNELIKYSADVVTAQNKRSSSSARGGIAEQEFRNLTTQMPVFANGADAEKWARQVEKSAADWAKFDKRLSDGNEDFAKAVRRQENAQDAVDKAEERIRKGREMKAEAETKSRLAR